MKKAILSVCMAVIASCLSAQSMTPKDAQFAKDAYQAGMLEIKLGELTISKANSDSLKVLGQQMVMDHTKTNHQLEALAVSKNIMLPGILNDENQAQYSTLARLSGVEFEKAFAAQTLRNHQKLIALFKEEDLSGSDKELRDWASVTLPVLKHHLLMSEDLNADFNKK